MRIVMKFGKKGNISPRYVGPCKILKRVVKVSYDIFKWLMIYSCQQN